MGRLGLGEDNVVDHMDYAIACLDIGLNNVGGAAVGIGQNAARLPEASTLQSADAVTCQDFCGFQFTAAM